MNWLDILIIIILIAISIFAIKVLKYCINSYKYYKENNIADYDYSLINIIMLIIVIILFIISTTLIFLNIDKSSGSTIGTITSIEKNFFGTTSVYVKVSENHHEKFCVEDSNIVKIAEKNINKKVKVEYGTRVGFYSTGRCSQAPLEKITVIE